MEVVMETSSDREWSGKIEKLSDLIGLADGWGEWKYTNLRIKKEILLSIYPQIKSINSFVAMNDIKKIIGDQIIYLLTTEKIEIQLHTLIRGHIGSGKTELAKTLAQMYVNLGIVSKIVFSDPCKIIGKNSSDTFMKIKNFIESSEKVVFVIDEDIVPKDVFLQLNKMLENTSPYFICIMTGSNKTFARISEFIVGFKRRFQFIFKIESNDSEQLASIMVSIIEKNGMTYDDELSKLVVFFTENKDSFRLEATDLKIFFNYIRIAIYKKNSKKITMQEILLGYENYSIPFKDDDKAPVMMYS